VFSSPRNQYEGNSLLYKGIDLNWSIKGIGLNAFGEIFLSLVELESAATDSSYIFVLSFFSKSLLCCHFSVFAMLTEGYPSTSDNSNSFPQISSNTALLYSDSGVKL